MAGAASHQGTKAERSLDRGRMKRRLDALEERVGHLVEAWVRDRRVLEPTAALLSGVLRSKHLLDRGLRRVWRGLGLPSRRDQERTLHLLYELESKLMDLEERLEASPESARGTERSC